MRQLCIPFRILVIGLIVLLSATATHAATNRISLAWVDGDTDLLITPVSLPDTVTCRILIENPDPSGDLTALRFYLHSAGAEIADLVSPFGVISPLSTPRFYELVPTTPLPLPPGQTTEVATFTVAVTTPDQINIQLGTSEYDLVSGTGYPLDTLDGSIWSAWINPGPPQLTMQPLVFGPRGTNRGAITEQGIISNDPAAGPFFFDPDVMVETCGPFQVLNADDLVLIGNGSFARLDVTFGLAAVGEYDCLFPLGGGEELPVSGIWREPIHMLSVTPDTADFGEVPVGGSVFVNVYLQNDGDYIESRTPTVVGEGDLLTFFHEEASVYPGESAPQSVFYWAPDFAERTWLLDFGYGAETILLGRGRVGIPSIRVNVDTLKIFPGRGETTTSSVGFLNNGEITLTPEFVLDDPSGLFAVVGGVGQTVLPGKYGSVDVSYTAGDQELRTASLDFGPGLDELILVGEGMNPFPSGVVSAPLVEFPPTAVDQTVTIPATLRNTGNTPLNLVKTSTSPDVWVQSPGTVQPGRIADLLVNARPGVWGQVNARVVLHRNPDLEIEVVVPPIFAFGPDENRLSVFFDPAYTVQDTTIPPAPQVLNGYLVLRNPTPADDIAGWDCRLVLPDGAALVGATPTGVYLDAASALEDFQVSLTGEPLPYATDILLAQLQMIVWDPAVTDVVVQVRPLDGQTVPGLPVWTPAATGADPVPMAVSPGAYRAGSIALRDPLSQVADRVLPAGTSLLANVPNPFNPQTEIRFDLAQRGPARLRIFNLRGHLVRNFATTEYPAGRHAVVWDGRDVNGRRVASGTYFYRLEAGDYAETRAMALIK